MKLQFSNTQQKFFIYTRFSYLFGISFCKASLNDLIQTTILWKNTSVPPGEAEIQTKGITEFPLNKEAEWGILLLSPNIKCRHISGHAVQDQKYSWNQQTFWQLYCPGADRLLSMNLLLTKHIHHWKRFRILKSTLL